VRDGVEGWAPRDGKCRTPPGPEGSNGKTPLPSAVGVPDRSRFRTEFAVRTVRLGVHGLFLGNRMTYQVLARKWRPQAFEAVVGQDAITRTLRNALASGRIAHAYLFAGPRGIGKTTTARLLARSLLCAERSGPEPCGKCPVCLEG